jgi:hypothetical protein
MAPTPVGSIQFPSFSPLILQFSHVEWSPKIRVGDLDPGNQNRLAAFSRPDSPRVSRQRGGYAMWTSLFAVTAVIAIALTMAAIVVDSVNGGKFRL